MIRLEGDKPGSNGRSLPVFFNCSACPAYCCSYDRIDVSRSDIKRLAGHFHISYERAEKRYTKIACGNRVLRHRKDRIFKSVCRFLDKEARRCTIYEARPDICRGYPYSSRCGYYDFLASERRRQIIRSMYSEKR